MNESAQSRAAPRWNGSRRELHVGGQLVKRFRQPAQNQELLLAVFEEESWPERVDNPFHGNGRWTAADRLHATVRRLNQQIVRRIRFLSDGLGQGARWEIIDDAYERTKSAPSDSVDKSGGGGRMLPIRQNKFRFRLPKQLGDRKHR